MNLRGLLSRHSCVACGDKSDTTCEKCFTCPGCRGRLEIESAGFDDWIFKCGDCRARFKSPEPRKLIPIERKPHLTVFFKMPDIYGAHTWMRYFWMCGTCGYAQHLMTPCNCKGWR